MVIQTTGANYASTHLIETNLSTGKAAKAWKAAQDFETAYIAQMLTFSGLDKAITSSGGDDMAAFASFYVQSFAEEISEKGGFGLAKDFYAQIIKSNTDSTTPLGKANNV